MKFTTFMRVIGLMPVTLLFYSELTAQTTNSPTLAVTTVVPPSPTAQAMQKYGDIPVSPYTGVPNISIPLYTIKYHDITVPVSLTYHASGIKVAEEASNVGLGWVLNAGGAVTRNIIGSDDFFDYTKGYYPSYLSSVSGVDNIDIDQADGYQPVSLLNNGAPVNAVIQWLGTFVYNKTTNGTTTQINNPIYNYLAQGKNLWTEFQPDQFYYNLPDLSGKFLLKRNGQAVLQGLQKLDISNSNSGYNWDIKTVDGFDYQFNAAETSRSSNEATGIKHVSAVYLSQITSPTGNVVTFNYTSAPAPEQSIGSWTESKDLYVVPQRGFGTYLAPPYAQQSAFQFGNTVYLNYIDYGTGRVVFNYVNNTRNDINNENQLNSVTVYSKDGQGNLTLIKTYTLGYGYFTGSDYPNQQVEPSGTTSTIYHNRLQLQTITENGTYNGQSITLKPYQFSYNTTGSLPSKTSLGRDHWGYYNALNNQTLIPPPNTAISTIPANSSLYYSPWFVQGNTRDANAGSMPAFTLTDIKYPSGGTTHFDFEPNDCDEIKSEINDQSGDPFLYSFLPQTSQPNSWTVGTANTLTDIDVTNGYTDANNSTIPGTLKVTFVLSSTVTAGNLINLKSGIAYLQLQDQNNKNIGGPIDASLYGPTYGPGQAIIVSIPLGLNPGKYHLIPYGSTTAGYQTQNQGSAVLVNFISVTANWFTKVNDPLVAGSTNPITYSLAGGLRIKRITDNDGINPPVVKRFIYHYNVGQTPEYSYGRRMSRPEYNYYEQSENDQHTGEDAGCPTPGCDVFSNSEHLMQLSDSNIPLNGSAQGMVVGYDQVTVNYGENGENGKTVYQYHNNPDLVLPWLWEGLPERRPYNSNIQDPLNGSLINQTDFKNINGQFIPVKEVNNTYVKNPAKENYYYAIEDHVQLHVSTNDQQAPAFSYTTIGAADRLLYVYSPMQSEWTYQSSSDVKDYASTDPTKYSETLTNYYYDNPNHYLPTRTVTSNSKGEILTNTTAYPMDFTSLSGSDDVSKGVQNLITNHLLNAPVEKYAQRTNSDGSSLRTTSGLLTAYAASGWSLPATMYQLQSVQPLTNFISYASSGSKNTAYWPGLYFDKFEAANSNLLQQHKYKNVNYSYQWGYNNAYPIAQCKNAAVNQFFYQGFEGSTASGVTSTGTAHTGHSYYSGSSYTVSWTVPDALTYVISYWYLNGTTWTYSGERSYTGSSYNLTGGSGYDDIRIYPSEAQMSTYTYDIGVGMTSSTDPRGQPTYFEYDGLSRLMNIKDANGNIIKNFSYNFATTSVGGQTTYYSAAQAGIYQKATGCTGTATLGTSVLYTVPPGKYTSTVSQATADGLALNEITNYAQTYANNNGGCVVPLFYSDPISAPYTPACPAGYSSASVTVTVPYGQSTSSVSKAAANQSAQAYAQSQANAQGTCTVPSYTFTVSNNTGGVSGFILQFSGPNSINYNVPATGSGSVSIPQGSYTLTINPPPTSGNYPNYKFLLGSRAPFTAPGVTYSSSGQNSPAVNIAQNGELSLLITNP